MIGYDFSHIISIRIEQECKTSRGLVLTFDFPLSFMNDRRTAVGGIMIPSRAENKYNIADGTSQTSEEKLRPPCRSNSGRRERKKEREK